MDSHSASEALGVRSDVQSVSDLPAQRRTPTSAPRHRPRDGPKRKPARELPEELHESEEAVAVWAAAKASGPNCMEAFVYGWCVL